MEKSIPANGEVLIYNTGHISKIPAEGELHSEVTTENYSVVQKNAAQQLPGQSENKDDA